MKRQHIIFVISLIALLGSAVAVYGTQQERNFQLRGYVDASQDANLPFRVPRFGVNAELSQYDPDELDEQLDLMSAAHVNWVRQVFPWDRIEPEQGIYDWETWDRIVDTVGQREDIRIIAVLMFTPSWTRTTLSPDQRTAPPSDPVQFGNFAAAFAERYGKSIDYYQIWDEPNLTEAWGKLEPRAVDYLAMLREAYTAIHAADRYATVISGALAPTTETGPQNISDIVFLRDLYALGAGDYMDAVGAKPYGFSMSPDDRTVTADVLNFSRIIALREEMVVNNHGTQAIWAMNWGWNSLPPDWSGSPSIWGNVTIDNQISYSLAALERAEGEWPWLAGMIIQHWQPAAEPDDPIWGFALINQQNEPTPLYHALAQREQPEAATNGLYAPTTQYATYTGVWTFGQLGADIGWVQDSQLKFEFEGRAVSLLLHEDDYTAYLYPTIDGQPANSVPHDASGNAYIVLTSGSLTPETKLVPVATDLTLQKHTLHVVADRGWDRWAIAGFGVSSIDLAAPYRSKLTVTWIAFCVSCLSVIVAAWQINWSAVFQRLTLINRPINTLGQLFIGAATSLALLIGMLLTWGDGTPQILRRESVQLGLAIVSAGILYLEPGFILTIVAAICLFILIYHRIDIGLALTIFWGPFFLFPIELYIFSFPLAEILIVLTTAAWALHLLRSWGLNRQSTVNQFARPSLKQLIKPATLDYCVLAFVVIGIISLSWAEFRDQAITELRTLIIEPALFYLILRSTPLKKKSLLLIVDAMLLAGFIVAVVGLWQFFQGDAVITAEAGSRRLASVYGSPNNVGLFLGRCIPFALAFLIIPVDAKRRVAAAISLVLMGVAVVLSQSAGAIFIGVPTAIVVVVLLSWGKRARIPLLILTALLLIGFLVSLQSARFARVLDFDSGTNFYRLRVWQSAINVIRDYPITGLGLDQFLYAFRDEYIMPDAWQEPNLSHPHNIILDFWIRLGIPGIVILLITLISFWKCSRKAMILNQNKNPILFALTVGTVASMTNLLSHGLVDNSVFVHDLSYVFMLLLALSVELPNTSAIDEALL